MKTLLTGLGIFALSLSFMAIVPLDLDAQSCTPLTVVEGQGNSVTKKISPPDLLVTGDNWNTDFAVPNGRSFRRYVAVIQSDSTATENFPVEMYLKYSDGTADQTFNGGLQIPVGQSKTIAASPRIGQQPYQVNLKIGSLDAVGYSYTLTVKGCDR